MMPHRGGSQTLARTGEGAVGSGRIGAVADSPHAPTRDRPWPAARRSEFAPGRAHPSRALRHDPSRPAARPDPPHRPLGASGGGRRPGRRRCPCSRPAPWWRASPRPGRSTMPPSRRGGPVRCTGPAGPGGRSPRYLQAKGVPAALATSRTTRRPTSRRPCSIAGAAAWVRSAGTTRPTRPGIHATWRGWPAPAFGADVAQRALGLAPDEAEDLLLQARRA